MSIAMTPTDSGMTCETDTHSLSLEWYGPEVLRRWLVRAATMSDKDFLEMSVIMPHLWYVGQTTIPIILSLGGLSMPKKTKIPI